MTQITKALIWAAVILGFALATSAGLIDGETARPMFLLLPVLAVLTLGNAHRCARKSEGPEQKA